MRVTKKVPLGEDRRAAIADAAIQLVATRGLRGLTHRAVDEEAGLPPGSTSYYLRTRGALLTACVNRMLERDLARNSPPAGPPSTDRPTDPSPTPPAGPPSDAELRELLVRMVVDLARDRPYDLIARYELSLEASRQPELRDAITQGGRLLREGLADLLAALGVPDADTVAWPVAAMMDGLLYDRVAGAGTTLSAEAFESGVRQSLAALLSGLRHA
ncbi:TetR/AcrR family transcriptional regulator [Kribbella koreensis]|uniref:TetR/AcrR family transcriptional regulator n=1 Tax=Kribbella koreensis TaxID=57909 RepID=A0ABP4BFH6_9ACTN